MKKLKLALVTVMMVLLLPLGYAASVSGTWTTIDDKDGKKRALVRVTESGGKLGARIIKVIRKKPGDTGICKKCPGSFKGKPVKGLTIMWGLKKTGPNQWSGGKILDPKSGKVYNATVTLKGNKLHVRGYVGVSMFGRTQVWVR